MKIDELYALLRRRGVLWPTAEIYGGLQGLYDYGPLGAALKRNVENAWSAWFLGLSPDYHRIEPAEFLPEATVRASGHLENFTDTEVTCESCGASFRADTLLEKIRPEGIDGLSASDVAALVRTSGAKCPSCGSSSLKLPRAFNMMLGVGLGVAGGEKAYLQPETAQASYLAFARMWDVGRRALPLGIGVIGRAYRNEIAPRQVLFRMRAFTQAELQVFFDPAGFPVPFATVAAEPLPVLRASARESGATEAETRRASELVAAGIPEFYVYHLAQMFRFLRDVLGYPAERLRFLEKSEKERAFYNRIQFDAEARIDSLGGFREVGAVHYRGDYDLTRHAAGSGRELAVTPTGGATFVPHVLELTFGVDRNVWALADLHLARDGERTVWKLPAFLAPIEVGVLPLIGKEHGAFAEALTATLLGRGLAARYDEAGSIGRRYARMDEAGTPFCVTVDGGTVGDGPEHGTVTLRLRDSRAQERVPAEALPARLEAAVRPPRPAVP